MVHSCVVKSCPHNSEREDTKKKGISFHRLPFADQSRMKLWLTKIERTDSAPTNESRICSEHFEPWCIETVGYGLNQRKMLKDNAVPTIFSFEKTPSPPASTVCSELPTKQTPSNDENLENESPPEETTSVTSACNNDSDLLLLREKIAQLEIKNDFLMGELNRAQAHCKKIEAELNEKVFCVKNLQANEKVFKFYTGFTIPQFEMCCEFIDLQAASELRYWGSSSHNEVPGDKRGPCRHLFPEDEFLLVLCRLRVGLLEEDLAQRFQVSQSTVSRIFTTWINFLYRRFQELDIWPSSEQCRKDLPAKIKEICPNVRCIIDATEIFIEKPTNPEAQQLTFSSYKNTNTLKALVGITGSGAISFVSELYGGSVSDRDITVKSGLLDKDWARGDVLMADRGFDIQDLLDEMGVKLNIPPFLRGKNQFDEQERDETRRIASCRIHVERAMERIKTYHILDFIPITMCSSGTIDQIFFVCAMLSNFLQPLVG